MIKPNYRYNFKSAGVGFKAEVLANEIFFAFFINYLAKTIIFCTMAGAHLDKRNENTGVNDFCF